jgi:AcrR family transcriptional regulator
MGDDSTDEIMGATYRALCKHGYANLTMQDIADESTKSKAALHYHYGSKQELLLAFLDFLYERFEERIVRDGLDDPDAKLGALIERVLARPDRENDEEFQTAVLEIKAQAPYDDAFRERLGRFDSLLLEEIRSIIDEGRTSGVFRAGVDAGDVATFLVDAMNGAHLRHVTLDRPTDATRRMIGRYVETELVGRERAGVGAE